MKGRFVFRIFVDISSYPYEFFVLNDFIIRSISFVVVHLHFILVVKFNMNFQVK
jgi:hypothetical protein